MLSIYTATYNRAYILKRAFDSLNEQTCLEFEWVVWDDGSTDGTAELVKQFEKNAKFKITYIKKAHLGYTVAFNAAADVCNGDYILFLDSNKWLDKNCVSNVKVCLKTIDNSTELVAVAGLRANENNRIYGGKPSFNGKPFIDVSNLDRWRYGLGAEKAEVYNRQILSRYKLPEYDGETFATEAIIFDQIAADGYKVRWFPIIFCYAQDFFDDGLTKQGANSTKGHIDNYRSYLFYVRQSFVLYSGKQKRYLIDDYLDTEMYLNHNLIESAKNVNISFMLMLFYWIEYKINNAIDVLKRFVKRVHD